MLPHLKNTLFQSSISFLFPPRRKVGAKVLCDETKESFAALSFVADERKLTTLSQSASAPSCQDNHHSQCNLTYLCEQCLNITMARFYLGTAEIFHFVIATNNKGSSKIKRQKRTFSLSRQPLPSFPQLIEACLNIFEDHLLLLQDATESKRRNLCRQSGWFLILMTLMILMIPQLMQIQQTFTECKFNFFRSS